MSTRTRIQLCGQLLAEVGGRRVEQQLRGRQGRLLFTYLVLARERPVSRDELVDALWGDAAPARPGASLSALLSELRKALAQDAELRGRSDVQLALPADAWVDVDAAREGIARARDAVASGAWQDAWGPAHVALSVAERGFLPGEDAPWIDAQRRELEELLLDALEAVAEVGLELGGSELAAAERAARRLVELAPYRESGYATLMQLAARQGNVAEALQIYDTLTRLLVDEMGTTPGAAVRQLHERLLGAGEAAADPGRLASTELLALPSYLSGPPGEVFVGREDELATLAQRLEEVERGGGRRVVLLAGEPGMGKTRLAVEFARRAYERGATVLYGRSFEETIVSYEPFVTALGHYVALAEPEVLRRHVGGGGGELARLLPELRQRLPELPAPIRGDPEGERYRAFEAVAELLARASESRPLVLVLDDLHWADTGSLLLLRHIARHPTDSRVLIVAAYREGELPARDPVADALMELRRDQVAETLALRGLEEEHVAALVAALRGAPGAEGLVRALRDETAGNPFFVGEVVQHLAERGYLSDDADPSLDFREIGVPRGVTELIAQRVARLGEPLERVLIAASVLGRGFRLELLQPLTGWGEEELAERLEDAMRAGLVVEAPGSVDEYAFSHALIQETLYGSLSVTRRTQLHREAGEALERLVEDDARRLPELAHHFLAAVAAPDLTAKAVDYARRAADEALARVAYEEAVGWYERALAALGRRAGGDEVERCRLLLAKGHAQSRTGDREGARATFGRAAQLARRAGAAELLAAAALEFGVRYPEAGVVDEELIALLEDALAALPDEDSALRARVLARLGQALYYTDERERWRALSEEGVATARRVGDPAALAQVLASTTFWDPDDHARRLDVGRELVELAERAGDKELILLGHHWNSWNVLELGDRAAAERERDAVDRIATELRQPFLVRFTARWRVVAALLDGRFAEVEPLAQDAVVTAQRAQSDDAAQIFALHVLMLRREQGRLGELRDAVEEFAAQHPRVPAWRCGVAVAYAETGALERAREAFEPFARQRFRNVPRDVFWLVGLTFLSDACVLLEDADSAALLHGLLAPYEERVVIVGDAACLGPVVRTLGRLEATMSRWDDAERSFERAVEMAERLASPPLLAHVHADWAAMLGERGAAGDAERAERLVADARRAGERLGMAKLLERIDALGQPQVA